MNKKTKEILKRLSIKFAIILGILIGFQQILANSNGVQAATDYSEKQRVYLSDIPYNSDKLEEKSSVAWGSITMDKNLDSSKNNGLISLIVDDKPKTFLKGISAHANSQVIFDVEELVAQGFTKFSTYYGVDAGRGSTGVPVAFKITYKTDVNAPWQTEGALPLTTYSYKGDTPAGFIEIDLTGKKFIKLEAWVKGGNTAAHACYGNLQVYKPGFTEESVKADFIKTVEEYDSIIKEKSEANNFNITDDYELTLLQRDLVNTVGYDLLQEYVALDQKNLDTVRWLMTDLENLRLYMMGGTPDGGSYFSSLTQLSKLYDEYSTDFTNNTPIVNEWCEEGMTRGDLYKKMAITLSLTHSQSVALWMHAGAPENQSDALRRYAIYKYMYENGKLSTNLNGNWDMTKWFESLKVEEMRFIMNNAIDDESILWLNTYVQDRLDQYKGSNYLTPHPYIAYVWPDYTNPVYYNNDDYFNEHFAVNKRDDNTGRELVNENGENTGKVGLFDTEFIIPGGKNISTYTLKVSKGTSDKLLSKVWMNFTNKFGTGAVCGGISKSGSNIRTTHGIPATVIGQPAHAALLCYTKTDDGKGQWGIDNDVSGWTQSEKGERMLLGWGNASYSRGYSVVYMVLAQEAINDYENLIKAEELVMLAKVYNSDLADETKKQDALAKQEEIYRNALKAQPINIDAWYGLINIYNVNENKTEDDFYDLAEELAENLKCFPLPMYHLTNLIKPKLTSVENSYKFTLLQARILKAGSTFNNAEGEKIKVLQPGVTRTEANYLLGQVDTSIATFSFNGADAGKIVLSSRFDGNGVRIEYSLDGKQNWTEVAFEADAEHKLQLTPEQISSITADNDIYINIVGVPRNDKTIFQIDILDNVINESMYFANDLENRVMGVALNCEWRNSEDDSWTSYSVASPDLTGNKTVQIRQAANGTKLASNVLTYTFHEDNQPDTRKYIPVSHLSIHSVSTQATSNQGAATYAIDGNYNTRWHSAWNGTDTERYIVIKLDKSVVLSAVEFVPAGGGNGRIVDGTVYGSMDGEAWEELAKLTGQTYAAQANTNEQAIAFTKSFEIENPKEVQYVKIVADKTNGNWFTARAFNLYQDLTQNPHPTAGIAYSTTEPTNGTVVARLTNPSTEITITNNNGSDTYVFTENGEFTFEFVDKNGKTGSAVATVTWIDKNGPTADINYALNDDQKLSILLDNISKDVYLLDENNNKINYIEVDEKSKKITNISYLDNEGNTYKVVDKDLNGNTTKITYKNTIKNPTGNVSNVATYITTLKTVEDGNEEIRIGEVIKEEYFDNEGNPITNLTDAEKQEIRTLQQTARSNPLEKALETSGEYEFKMLDKANNMLCKSIQVDYLESSNTIIASDITYNITRLTNTDVIATINPYIIDIGGKHASVEVISEGGTTHTFTENAEFTFKYKSASDTENLEVKQHKAKVDWIDKVAPTAEIIYSTTEATDKSVVATLVNESEEIVITNNGTNRDYTFIENGTFTFKFQDKAGNEGTAIATVDWIVEDTTITSEKYKVRAEYISRIPIGTTVAEFKQNVNSSEELTITDANGNALQDEDTLVTGMILNAGTEKQYTLVLIGDIDRNGEITITDLVKLNLFTVHILTPDTVEKLAADMDGNGEITITDLVQLNLKLVHIEE